MKLRKKLVNKFTAIALISIVLTAVLSTVVFWFAYSSLQENDLKTYTNTLVNSYNFNDDNIIKQNFNDDNIRVTLILQSGKVVYDNGADANKLENHSNRPEFKQAVSKGFGTSQRMSDTIKNVTYYYAVKADNGNILRVSKTVVSMFGVFASVLPYVFLIMVCVYIICFFIAKRATKQIILPIENMSKNLDNISYEELVPLSEKITSQQKEIKKQMQKLQLEKDKIDTLIQNMSEGFILIDMDKNILMSNNSATKLIGANDSYVSSKSLIAYSRNSTVCDCIDNSIKGKSKIGDTSINGRALQIMTNPVYSNDKQNGVICLIIDVSEKKKAEKMRREFTANVSHELKTPLTSISGYAEIISSGLVRPDDVQGFAKKIHKESGRMLSLIGDIIELSQLDESSESKNYTKFDISGVATEVADDLISNAKKRGVTISVNASPAYILGNRNQIYELIYNLCDNAIRYNKENGKVNILIRKDRGSTFLTVADTGIGIPEKHQKRIFERFYRVDKSRSKETGGTGLGLAIVKHIVEQHNGLISVESNENGSEFKIVFKSI